MYGILKVWGKKNLIRKLASKLVLRKGWFIYSTLRFPFDWEEV